jgi:phosphotransferase system IIB component
VKVKKIANMKQLHNTALQEDLYKIIANNFIVKINNQKIIIDSQTPNQYQAIYNYKNQEDCKEDFDEIIKIIKSYKNI